MAQARYNIFQSLVRQWERLHPYNGAQAIRVNRPLPPSIDSAWHEVQHALGLGPVIETARSYSLFPPSPAHSSVLRLNSLNDLEPHLTSCLNHPYSTGQPFLSPFLLPESPTSFWMGLGYRHYLADSVAIRAILSAWFQAALFQHPPPAALSLPSAGYWSLFGSADAGGPLKWSLFQAFLESARQSSRMKRVQRIKSSSSPEQHVTFSLHPQPPDTLPRLLAYARSHRAKVNDVLLAALAIALAQHGPLSRTPARQDLALGTIVDLRPLAPSPHLDTTLGLYLGFTTTFLRPHHLRSLAAATRAVSLQQRLARDRLSAASSLIRIYTGNIAHRIYPRPADIASFYRKRVPLSAGISNVNLTQDPISRFHPDPITHFVRASPTGPLMPLVISATTLGPSFHFGLTRRTSAVPTPMAQAIAQQITTLLQSLP